MNEVHRMNQDILKMKFQLKEIKLNLDEQNTVAAHCHSVIGSATCEVGRGME
jgi:hypothetical protein